jgi:hemerythrin-like domain-containing protein
MKPVGILMIEHRLIERMLEVARKETLKAEEQKSIKPAFIDTTVDFLRFYADRTHHAKEEDILFRSVAGKAMSPEHRAMLQDLLDEHNFARKNVREMLAAKERYQRNDGDALTAILDKLKLLADFYQEHINKEDKIFFPACMEYLSEEEQEAMLQEFWESDRRMIHEKYTSVVEHLEHKLK